MLTPDRIAFNGVGSNAHESFWIDRVPEKDNFFSFCKTARKPYDVVVVAALCLLDETGGFHKISSDGGPLDWQAGLDLAQKVLRTAAIPAGIFYE